MVDSVQILSQRVDELDGSRRLGGNRDRAAARLGDFAGLLQLPETKAAHAAGAAPTAAEFDALVDDVAAINRRLQAVIQALRARMGR